MSKKYTAVFGSHTTGLVIALAAGVILGTAVVISRFAYEGGASGLLIATIRMVIMCTAMAFAIKITRNSLALPRKLIAGAIVNGTLMALMTYGNIGAVEFISIGLTSLLFFTFPIIIAASVIALRIEKVRIQKLICVLVAFFGITIMLGSSLGNADLRGVVLALMAAIATAINAILIARHFRQINVFVATFHFSIYGFFVLLILGLVLGGLSYPTTFSGWVGTIGVGVLQTIGTPMYLFAISKIGALKAGMATNIQPVAAITEAWFIFGEILSLGQAFGGLTVLLAIAVMQWSDLRKEKLISPT